MIDRDYLERVHRLLRRACDECEDHDLRQEYMEMAGVTWNHLRLAARDRPIVFDLSFSGYVTLGAEGNERTFLDPGLIGLQYAWRIFLGGISTRACLHAADLLDHSVNRPGNTIRTRIAAAADWVERVAGCTPLAVAMRRPSISISDAGEIAHDPALGPRIILQVL